MYTRCFFYCTTCVIGALDYLYLSDVYSLSRDCIESSFSPSIVLHRYIQGREVGLLYL